MTVVDTICVGGDAPNEFTRSPSYQGSSSTGKSKVSSSTWNSIEALATRSTSTIATTKSRRSGSRNSSSFCCALPAPHSLSGTYLLPFDRARELIELNRKECDAFVEQDAHAVDLHFVVLQAGRPAELRHGNAAAFQDMVLAPTRWKSTGSGNPTRVSWNGASCHPREPPRAVAGSHSAA